MDEIKQLEQQLSSLQDQLHQQNVEAEQIRQKIIDDNRIKLQNYQNDMKHALQAHDKATRAEYERLLSVHQRDLGDKVEFELTKMEADYRRLVNEAKKTEAVLLEKNRELEEAIKRIRNDISMRNKGNSEEANQYIDRAISTFRMVQEKPCEKFMPNRLRTLYDKIMDGKNLIRDGLFEAATAVAISAKGSLEILGYSVDDKVTEWDRQYDLFALKLDYLQAKINQEFADWEEHTRPIKTTVTSDKKDRLIEMSFWSRGEFEKIAQFTEEKQRIVSAVNANGRAAYVKLPDSLGTDELKEIINEIDEIDRLLTKEAQVYKRRYDASCERTEWGEALIDSLEDDINLSFLEDMSGFKPASDEEKVLRTYKNYIMTHFKDADFNKDTREWLSLVFTNMAKEHIYVYLLPVESTDAVTNHIILHIDYNGPEQELYSTDIHKHIREVVGVTTESGTEINYTADLAELKKSENKIYTETGRDIERLKQQILSN